MNQSVILPTYHRGAQPPAIDRGVISDLRLVLGEEGANTLADLIDLFLSDAPIRFREIHQTIGKDCCDGIKSHIDFLRGWCETLGALEAASRCKDIQLFFENLEMDSEAAFDRKRISFLLKETEEAFARAASELLVITAEY
jgi:HPt (histidine-containing phosphotransfer) domain-containing protein